MRVGEDDHVAAIGEEGDQAGNVEAGVAGFFFSGGIEGAVVLGHVETLGACPVFDVGIFDDAEAGVLGARASEIEPLAGGPEAAV